MAYIERPKIEEHHRTYRKRVYWTLREMEEAGNPLRVMCIRQLYPTADWEKIWNSLHAAVRVNWYGVIHDILPTNERLHKIRLTTL